MACDHLDKKTFDNAMEVIKDDYYDIAREFNGGLEKAMKSYYDAWQSKKGFSKINDLYSNIANGLENASMRICINYNTMKKGGEAYAKSQDMWLIIGDIDRKDFSMEKQDFAEDREIIIDDAKIAEAGKELEESLKKLNGYIDNSKTQTSSDEKFGYYSDNDTNPRLSINKAYTNLETTFNQAIRQFSANLEQLLEDDKAQREANKQAAAVDNSDFSDIF